MLKEILEESWAYQEMVEEAREKERSEQLQRERVVLVSYVETRFPELLVLAKESVEVISSPDELNDAMVKLFPLQEASEVRSYLLNILQRNRV